MPGAFDTTRPPPREVLDACIRCGFCLPTCPTFVLWGEEMDSPRGRIHLMSMGLDGEPMTPTMVGHLDACLGCMACVTACPSGVRYDEALEATRAQVERRARRPFGERLLRRAVFAVAPYPHRLEWVRRLLRLYRAAGLERLFRRRGFESRLSPTLGALVELAPPAAPKATAAQALPDVTATRGPKRARVGILTGCVQRVFFGHVNRATARVLSAEGCEVVNPPDQSCCGALSLHAGREAEAMAFARRTIDAFDAADIDTVVVNAAGCGSAMKEYGRLLRDDSAYAARAERFAARVRDVNEFLVELGPVATRNAIVATVAYHDACHLAHAQGVRSQPREVLRSIPGLSIQEIGERDLCCGSAGIYNILQPGAASELGERKARHVLATDPDAVVTSNPGCALQVAAHLRRLGRPLPVVHPMEILDASIEGRGRLTPADGE
jgi:glycolate oxidase iron-sulfur subunit